MDTLILYIIAAIAVVISVTKDRQKTVVALKKGWKALEGAGRYPTSVFGIIVMAFAIKATSPDKEVERIYAEAEHID